MAACPDSSRDGGTTYNYVCANGTKADGDATADNINKCAQCNDGFKLHNEQCVATKYTCEHGTPENGKPNGNVDVDKCKACNTGYFIPQGTSVCSREGQYFCQNGTARTGSTGSTEAVHECVRCFQGYTKRANNQCTIAVYTCTGGTPVTGGPSTGTQDVENCQRCSDGYKKEGNLCNQAVYTCTNGTPAGGNPTTGNSDMERCQSCQSGFIITANNTCNHRYICNNGTPTENTDATGDNVTQCASCITGYFVLNQTCVVNSDDDNDGVLRSNDVDDDNDGLIEVHNLTMLHNMRYNLAGTSYKTSSAGSGSTTGAPTSATTNCSSATGGVYLCGYELTQDLTFDKDDDGKTFTQNSDGTFTLDADDSTAPYFVTSQGGWLPLGDNTNSFVAIFEGNGHTISHIAMVSNQEVMGMFARTDTGAHIRNIGLLDGLADYKGSSGSVIMGGMVGYKAGGIITASYADFTVDAGGGSNDRVGVLVGDQGADIIIASYATGSVDSGGGGGRDYVGGLVGWQDTGSITASYATVSVDDRAGGGVAGGLVGYKAGGIITASYATGNVDGGSGDGFSGGLLGINAGGTVIASYATGNVNGGSGNSDYVGKLIGRNFFTFNASYGFGTKSGGENNGIDASTLPTGVTAPTAFTAANLTGCVGIANEKAYTSQTTCQATSKTACTWASSACSGTVTGIDCSVFTSQATCTATTGKTAGTWNGNVWNAAGSNTAGAWDFGDSSQAPALKYADYDGSGSSYNCNQFPTGKCNTLIPGQR